MAKTKHTLFFTLVAGIFLVLTLPNLVGNGMFMDGLLYSAIANNLADGYGSFWSPHLSETVFPVFHEHPPLALGLESIYHSIFGSGIWVERLYAVTTYAFSGWLMALIWKHLTGSFKFGWFPILLWIIIPNVLWSVANNMLENTMTIFVLASVYFYLKSISKPYFLIVSGLCIALAFLSKGVFGLYIWVLPGLYWLFTKHTSFIGAATRTLLVVGSTIAPLLIAVLVSDSAYDNLSFYLENQVKGSVQNVSTVDTRFQILIDFVSHSAIVLGVALLIYGLTYKQKFKQNNSISWVLFALVLCGILPIMISLKQREFYILTVYPLFTIGLSLLLLPRIKSLFDYIKNNPNLSTTLKGLNTLAFGTVIALFIMLPKGKPTRDHELIEVVEKTMQFAPTEKTISICTPMYSNWYLHGYFARLGQLSLDIHNEHPYSLLNKTVCENKGNNTIVFETPNYVLIKD